jgi:hypothetical protein
MSEDTINRLEWVLLGLFVGTLMTLTVTMFGLMIMYRGA